MAKIIKQVSAKLATIIQTLWKSNTDEDETDLSSQKDRRYFT